MHKIMYIILLLISSLAFSQDNENEIGKSEAFKKLMNLHKNASQEKHNIDYYSIQIYSGNYSEADSLYKFSNDLAPKYMEDIFKKSNNTHRTRYTNETKLDIPLRKHEYGKNCLSYLGAKIWNNLENDIKEAKSSNSFKHKIKDKFFKQIKLKEEDVYIY